MMISIGTGLWSRGGSPFLRYALGGVTPVLVEDFEGGFVSAPVTLTRDSTATYVDAQGVVQTAAVDTKRYDWSTGRRALLLDASATNLLLYSQDFSRAAWTKTRATITADATTAPDGTTTAAKLVDNTNTNSHYVIQTVTVAASATVAYSVYAKAGERTWLALMTRGSDLSDSYSYFDLANGVVGTMGHTSATIKAVGDGGWYRCSVVTDQATTDGNFKVYIYPASADATVSYTGDNTSGIYIWGAQLEVGLGPTSYIPTAGAAATRAADTTTVDLSALDLTEGYSLYIDARCSVRSAAYDRIVAVDDGTTSNGSYVLYYTISTETLYVAMTAEGASQIAVTQISAPVGTDFKAAFARGPNHGQYAINGTGTDLDEGVTHVAQTTMRFGRLLNGYRPAVLHVYDVRLFLGYLSGDVMTEATA